MIRIKHTKDLKDLTIYIRRTSQALYDLYKERCVNFRVYDWFEDPSGNAIAGRGYSYADFCDIPSMRILEDTASSTPPKYESKDAVEQAYHYMFFDYFLPTTNVIKTAIHIINTDFRQNPAIEGFENILNYPYKKDLENRKKGRFVPQEALVKNLHNLVRTWCAVNEICSTKPGEPKKDWLEMEKPDDLKFSFSSYFFKSQNGIPSFSFPKRLPEVFNNIINFYAAYNSDYIFENNVVLSTLCIETLIMKYFDFWKFLEIA